MTDTRFPNEGSGIYQRKGIVLRIQRPETDIKDRRTNLHESETALDLFQFTGIKQYKRSALFARSSKRIPLIISKAGGKHCRFSHKTTP
jgi:hypothetical protein